MITGQRYPGRGTIARPLEQTVEKGPNDASLAYERQLIPANDYLARRTALANLLAEYNSTAKKRGCIAKLAEKYSLPRVAASKYLARHLGYQAIFDLPEEEWKPVVGFEGRYEVSSLGRVKCIPSEVNRRWTRERELIGNPNRQGYIVVGIRLNGKAKTVRVHRLVAIAFIPNPDNLPEVNHLDGDKLNNRKSNLEWCTSLENKSHAWKMGLYSGTPIKHLPSHSN